MDCKKNCTGYTTGRSTEMCFLFFHGGLFMKKIVLALSFLAIANVCEARGGRYYYYPNSASNTRTYSYTSSQASLSDQERCQAEADYMAANNISGHVWGCIGRFEGVGYGSSPNCNTCTPGSSMMLTGDACAQGRNGMWYRVRSWR